MENNFVSYEIALELKELGFDEKCLAIYSNANRKTGLYTLKEFRLKLIKQYSQENKGVKAPLFQEVFDWFREKHKLHSTITSISQESWQWHITKPGESLGKVFDEDFYSYEEARLACLQKLIEICKEKKS
jgi:hypothetical protein